MAQKAVYVLHAGWALLNFALCVLLALLGGGHPPPMVFIPFVLVAWVIGHLGLWLMLMLARVGRRGLPDDANWPPGLILALVGLTAITALTILQVAVTLQVGEFYPYRASLWFLMLGIGAVHVAALIGILLRRGWGRLIAMLACLGWSALLAWQVLDQLSHNRPISAGEGTLALVLFAAPATLGLHLLISTRVRAFFASD